MCRIGQIVTDQIIEIGIQTTTRHLGRILHLQRSGSRIARIGKQWLLIERPFGIETVERLPWQQDLASYLKTCRPVRARQLQGDAADSDHIISNIVALLPVAARNGMDKPSVLIQQRDRRAVKLHLSDNLHLLAGKPLAAAANEGIHLAYRISVSQREHRPLMHNLTETFGQIRPDTMGWRIRIVILRMLPFKPLKLLEKHIEILIGNRRGILHVIAMVMIVDLPTQRLYFFLDTVHILQR